MFYAIRVVCFIHVVYTWFMRRNYEQACMDIRTPKGEDCIDQLLAMPKLQGRVWKHLFDTRDLDGHVATINKEIAVVLEVDPANISRAVNWLVKNQFVQRQGIHFFMNPYRWWYGDDRRKQDARTEWDQRKELDEADR